MALNNQEDKNQAGYGGRYGKKSIWHWIILYLMIGLVVYGLIYLFLVNRGGGSSQPGQSTFESLYGN